MIHDVTTDADDAPRFVALRELRLQCRNGVLYSGLRGAAHHARYPDIAPALYAQPPATIFQAALAAAKAMRWVIAAAVESEGRIEATATTRFMRFKDDVVIRVRADAHANAGTNADRSGTRLDVRSASRVGSSDFGANARRIHCFLQEMDNCLKTNT